MTARKKATKAKTTAKTKAKVVKKVSKTSKKVTVKKLKVTDPFTKTELIKTISERTEIERKSVVAIIMELEAIIGAHLSKGGPGKFVLPGLLKLVVKKVPAKKARKGINPFTGETTTFKAKPASRKVKATPLKKLKEVVIG